MEAATPIVNPNLTDTKDPVRSMVHHHHSNNKAAEVVILQQALTQHCGVSSIR